MENKVCIPLDIIRNFNLSPRARIVWAELSLLPKGAVGEFVVKIKELSQLLGICDSTLRRAVKALEEAGLIQCVGLFEKRHKEYVFKNAEEVLMDCHSGLVPESIPSTENLDASLRWHDKEETPIPSVDSLDASLRWHDKQEQPSSHPITPFSNWQQTYKELKAQMKPEPAPKPEQKVDLSETDLLRMKYRFANGKPCSDDKPKLAYAQQLYNFYQNQWRAQFPLLNGLDNRPLLDAGLIEYIIMNEPANIAGEKMMDIVDKELQRFTDFPVDRA